MDTTMLIIIIIGSFAAYATFRNTFGRNSYVPMIAIFLFIPAMLFVMNGSDLIPGSFCMIDGATVVLSEPGNIKVIGQSVEGFINVTTTSHPKDVIDVWWSDGTVQRETIPCKAHFEVLKNTTATNHTVPDYVPHNSTYVNDDILSTKDLLTI